MIDKLFKYIDSLVDRLIKKDLKIKSYLTISKLFWGTAIIIFLATCVSTYIQGQCADCYELTHEQAEEMFTYEGIYKDIYDDKIGNTRYEKWKSSRTYVPFTSPFLFLKAVLISFSGPFIVFSIIVCIIYFIYKFIRAKLNSIYNNIFNKIKK